MAFLSCRGARFPEPAAPARSQHRGLGRQVRWVDDGPVELTDPGQIALDVGDDEISPADAEIIWDDAPVDPNSPKPPVSNRVQARKKEPDGEQFWEEDLQSRRRPVSADTTDRRRQKPGGPTGPPAADRASHRCTRAAGPPGDQSAIPPSQVRYSPERSRLLDGPGPASSEVRGPRKRPSRLSVVLIVVPLLVVATVAWRYWRQRRQEYPLIAETGRIEGIPALDEGNFDKAYQLLSAAKSAVDSLGGAVEDADEIRTAAAEAAIFVDQCSGTLEDMLEKPDRDPAAWASKFDTHLQRSRDLDRLAYHGRARTGRYVELPDRLRDLTPGGSQQFQRPEIRTAVFRRDRLHGLRVVRARSPQKGDHVTFGARLASFEFDPQNDVWWVGLEPPAASSSPITRPWRPSDGNMVSKLSPAGDPTMRYLALGHRDRLCLWDDTACHGANAGGSRRRRARRARAPTDLIGRQVVVDDHVKYYVASKRNGARRASVEANADHVPGPAPASSSGLDPHHSVIVRGVLARDEGRLVCEVTEIQPVSGDLDRLERGLASLSAKDFETRKAWAQWAERRASDFKDHALLDRAKALEGEALRIESEMKRLGVDAPAEWLAMAQDARRATCPNPNPALGHRAFRAKLAAATSAAELKDRDRGDRGLFPDAAADQESGRINLARWEGPYGDDPAGTYRESRAACRKGSIGGSGPTPPLACSSSRPHRTYSRPSPPPSVRRAWSRKNQTCPASLIEKATRAARQDLGNLRLSEVKALATVYREKLQQPDEALKILGDWLKIQQRPLEHDRRRRPPRAGQSLRRADPGSRHGRRALA